jgi:hypothetical protein
VTATPLRERLREATERIDIHSMEEGNFTAAVLSRIAGQFFQNGVLGVDDRATVDRIARKLDIAHALYVSYTDDWHKALIKKQVPPPVLFLAVLLFAVLAESEPGEDAEAAGRVLKNCNTTFNGLDLLAKSNDGTAIHEVENIVFNLCQRWMKS